MPLTPAMVDTIGPGRAEVLEDRWLMNYAAAVGDHNSVYVDNRDGHRLPAHPAYLSHQEWEAITALHEVIEGLTPQERQRGVHSYNDTHLLRPVRSGERICCTARVQAVEQRPSGGRLTLRVDTTDAAGERVATSLTSTVFRDVPLDGADTGPPPEAPQADAEWVGEPSRVETLAIDSLAPHIFSECARDYNPIHTDIALARRIDLPGLILHGTATFAIALSSLTNHELAGDPSRVRRFGGRLGAMLLCPSTARLEVRAHPTDSRWRRFDIVTDDETPVIANGFVESDH